mmetsp:Transcript_1326/g.1443  ORF Transcript_1326/g.1443 Transcript_1326/m.1443 type:complete len:620 (-) Transcript_1326:12-1871(-)
MYESCNADSDFEYALLTAKIPAAGAAVVSLGVCGPKQCSARDNYLPISNLLAEAISVVVGMPLEGDVEFPKQMSSSTISAGSWVMIFVTAAIFFMFIVGIVVQFTKLGDIRRDQNQDLKIEDRKTKLALVFYSFNPIVNVGKLFTVRQSGDDRLAVLNGVRVLSICWVVVGHAFLFGTLVPIGNSSTYQNLYKGALFGLIPGGLFAVDSFFFLSGFLTCFILAAKLYPKKGLGNFPLIIFHRYYRLIFPLVFITGSAMFVFKYLGDGPFYRRSWDNMTNSCNSYWWTNFLFINNLHPWQMGKECIGWVWYLANDFQFFLITPPIVFLYCRNRKLGYAAVVTLIVLSMLVNGVVTAVYNLSVTLAGGEINGQDVLYSKPWARMGAYFVGAVFGFSYFELVLKDKYPELKHTLANAMYERFRTSRLLSLGVAAIGVGLTAIFVFPLRNYFIDCGQGDNCWSRFASTVYNLVSRPLFVLGFGMVLLPTFVGRLRVVKNFLASTSFVVLARLNYMVYMNHLLFLLWFVNDFRQAIYINNLNMWFVSIGTIAVSFIFAVPMTLMWEVPFMNIEKYILFPAKKKPVKPENDVGQYELKKGPADGGRKYIPYNDDETLDSKRKLVE